MTGKSGLTERDICTQYVTPAIIAAGWFSSDLGRVRVEEAIAE